MLDKRDKLHISMLNALYGGLLPEKRREILTLYYDMDISLSELADQFLMTRQGARDTIKRAEEFLLETEEKLRVYERNKEIEAVLNRNDAADLSELKAAVLAVVWK